ERPVEREAGREAVKVPDRERQVLGERARAAEDPEHRPRRAVALEPLAAERARAAAGVDLADDASAFEPAFRRCRDDLAHDLEAKVAGVRLSDFDYDLPQDRIAERPVEPRDTSRLLVLDRRTGARRHTTFRHLAELLRPGDLLVLNETRVIPARLFGTRSTG